MKKKILFITPSLCQGGLEHSLITMLKLLDKNKYEMYLYTYREDLALLPLVPEYVHFKNDLLNHPWYSSVLKSFFSIAVKLSPLNK